MARVYNFSAGPSALPLEVLKKAQSEMLEYGSSGMSVMEMSHRSKDYDDIIKGAGRLRESLCISRIITRFFSSRAAVQVSLR